MKNFINNFKGIIIVAIIALVCVCCSSCSSAKHACTSGNSWYCWSGHNAPSYRAMPMW